MESPDPRADIMRSRDELYFHNHSSDIPTSREVDAEDPVGTRKEPRTGGTGGSLQNAAFEVERPFLYQFHMSFCRETVKRCPLFVFSPVQKKGLKDFDDL